MKTENFQTHFSTFFITKDKTDFFFTKFLVLVFIIDMNYSKNFRMMFLTFSMMIFLGIPSSSLVYSPVQRFWTRSLRGIDYKNTFEDFLSEYQTTSRSLQPSANENSYGKWWFLQNSVPFPIVPTENIMATKLLTNLNCKKHYRHGETPITCPAGLTRQM